MKSRCYLHFLAIMMVTMLGFCFMSCGSDDNADDEGGGSGNSTELVAKLQGTWKFTKGTETVMGMTINMDRAMLSQVKSSMEQATGQKIEFWDETLYFSGYQVNGVNYKLKGTQLILEGLDLMDGVTISVKSITESLLVLHEVISMEGIDLTADMEYSRQ